MSRERIVTGEALSPDEDSFNWSLRPKKLSELVGQKSLVQRLELPRSSAKNR